MHERERVAEVVRSFADFAAEVRTSCRGSARVMGLVDAAEKLLCDLLVAPPGGFDAAMKKFVDAELAAFEAAEQVLAKDWGDA